MNKKPNFDTKLKKARNELGAEIVDNTGRIERTSITLEAHLLYELKQLAAKRRYTQKKPDTISGIIREAIIDIVEKEQKQLPNTRS